MRNSLLTLALWTAVGLSACAMVRVEGGPPASTPTPTVTTDGARAATNLSATIGCSETELRKPIAQLRWTAATARGSEQYVDVTTRSDGFALSSYKSSPALAADATSFTWDAVDAGINHYWRVVTVYPGVAVASEIAVFKGAVCVADFQPSQSPGSVATASARATAAAVTLVPTPVPSSPAVTAATSAPVTTSTPAATAAAASLPSSPSGVDGASSNDANALLIAALVAAAALVGVMLWWFRRGPV